MKGGGGGAEKVDEATDILSLLHNYLIGWKKRNLYDLYVQVDRAHNAIRKRYKTYPVKRLFAPFFSMGPLVRFASSTGCATVKNKIVTRGECFRFVIF